MRREKRMKVRRVMLGKGKKWMEDEEQVEKVKGEDKESKAY